MDMAFITSSRNTTREDALLHSFFDSPTAMRGIVEMLDDDILFLKVNPKAAAFLGWTATALQGQLASEAGVTAETLAGWLAQGHDSQVRQAPITREYSTETPGGTVWVSITTSYLGLGDTGLPRFAFVGNDASTYKQIEAALRESEARYRQAIAAARAVAWEVDFDAGVLTEIGQTMEYFHRPEGTHPADMAFFLENVHPDDRARLMEIT